MFGDISIGTFSVFSTSPSDQANQTTSYFGGHNPGGESSGVGVGATLR